MRAGDSPGGSVAARARGRSSDEPHDHSSSSRCAGPRSTGRRRPTRYTPRGLRPTLTRINLSEWTGQDPRGLPAYSVSDAAHYLRIPRSTLRAWVAGQRYRKNGGYGLFQPIIALPDNRLGLLSFINLVEAHVLDALRTQHQIPLQKVRRALQYLARQLHTSHPLAEQRFETDGVNLFVRRYGQLVNISESGQLAMRRVIETYLRRIERDEAGLVTRLYPFTRKRNPDEPRAVVIDPRIAFGRPVLVGTGIPTAVVAERYKAGESVDELAGDYGRHRLEIEEALRCELDVAAA
jgi:uncharacterized protein (DUF433 family)